MSNLQIVIVDDNKEFTFILNEFLNLYKAEGIEIVGIAQDGLRAIELIVEKEPDVVILDIIMPKLDGIQVLKRINALNMAKKPDFFVLSAMDQDKFTQQALALGAKCYITKPFDMDVLVAKIKELQLLNV